MTKKTSIMFAMTGAILATVSQAQAQQTPYSDEDLLLNFRSINSATPPNVTVDLGNVNTFLSSVSPGGSVEVVNGSLLLPAIGTPSASLPLGFSAGAAQASSSTLWLTRVISGPSATSTGLTASAKQSASTQGSTAQIIGDMGSGYNGGSQLGGGNAATVPSGNALSYSSLALDGTGTMSYNGGQSVGTAAGGPLEGVQNGSGNVYEALWEVPPTVSRSNPGTPDTYEGYFTFQPDGEVDFTTASAVPEPSTYVLLLATGVFALTFRRQIRSLIA
jgi:hypothetical protein